MDTHERLKLRLTEDGNAPDDRIIEDCIETAKNAILSRRYPYGDWPLDENNEVFIEPRYEDLLFRISMDLYNKIGAEGELTHKENGVDRGFESSWISTQLLSEITPFIGVVT